MHILRKENGGFALENDFYKIRILYVGNDYTKALAAGELSADDILVTFYPKEETPFLIDFVLKNGSIDQNIGIRFDSDLSIPLTEVDDLCEALKGAKGTISDLMEAIDEYFPGVLAEECPIGI